MRGRRIFIFYFLSEKSTYWNINVLKFMVEESLVNLSLMCYVYILTLVL